MTREEQMDLWVDGTSVCPNDHGNCCPDFSCCNPKLLVPLEIRQMFRDFPERRETLGLSFLVAMFTEKFPNYEILVIGAENLEPWSK